MAKLTEGERVPFPAESSILSRFGRGYLKALEAEEKRKRRAALKDAVNGS